jgi:hypothetical protein
LRTRCRPGALSAGPGSCSGWSCGWPTSTTILLIGPIIILFLGIIADPEETHAVWYGMLNTIGIFDLSALTDIERLTYAEKRHYFWFGEVEMAANLAGTFAAPVGIFLAGRTDMSLAFNGAAVLFLPLFVFLPKLIQRAMRRTRLPRSRHSGRTNR